MAEVSGNFCVKCDEKLIDPIDKIIKCNGNCNKGLHFTCSNYNTSQLEFLKTNKNNVKWFCDGCSRNKAAS